MLVFAERPPNKNEIEQLRLVLSTYQDGYGQLAVPSSSLTLPGWRDFERAVASVFGGEAQESKAIYDVLFPNSYALDMYYGLSCKMRGTLDQTNRTGRVVIEFIQAILELSEGDRCRAK